MPTVYFPCATHLRRCTLVLQGLTVNVGGTVYSYVFQANEGGNEEEAFWGADVTAVRSICKVTYEHVVQNDMTTKRLFVFLSQSGPWLHSGFHANNVRVHIRERRVAEDNFGPVQRGHRHSTGGHRFASDMGERCQRRKTLKT